MHSAGVKDRQERMGAGAFCWICVWYAKTGDCAPPGYVELTDDRAPLGPRGELEWDSTASSRLGLGRLGWLGWLSCESLRSLRSLRASALLGSGARVKVTDAWADGGPKRIFCSELMGVCS